MMPSIVRTATSGSKDHALMANADNATPVRPFLVHVTQASGHQFDVEDCVQLVVEVGPDLDVGINTAAMSVAWKPTGLESMSASFSWIRVLMAMVRGRFRED